MAKELGLLLTLAQACSQLRKELKLHQTFVSTGQGLNCDFADVNRLKSFLNMVKPINHLKEMVVHLTMALLAILIEHPTEGFSSTMLTRSHTFLVENSRLTVIIVD